MPVRPDGGTITDMSTATLADAPTVDDEVAGEKSVATDLAAAGKQVILDQLAQFPDDALLEEIVEQLRLVVAVREGVASAARGEAIPMSEFKKQMATWDFS